MQCGFVFYSYIYLSVSRKAYFIFIREACPAFLCKTFCPFRVDRFCFIAPMINDDTVYYHGCHPRLQIYIKIFYGIYQ